MSDKFHRIYWSDKFNWKEYAKLYDQYCKSPGNYYAASAEALIDSAKLEEDNLIIDMGCGTGALTQVLLEKFPKIKVIAIDISKDAVKHYKENFKEQIETNQIKIIQGNAENIHKYTKEKADIIFIASSLWDMDLETLFSNLPKIMKPSSKVITNLPCLTIDEKQGFIHEIESFFKKEEKIKKTYRRILIPKLDKLLRKNNLKINKKEKYEFLLSKENIKLFFEVLKYRYPFIFFPEEIPYEERYEKTHRTFGKLLKKIPQSGIKEEGYIITITNN